MVKIKTKMRQPIYEPLKMGNPEHANKYGEKLKKYLKWKSLMEANKLKSKLK